MKKLITPPVLDEEEDAVEESVAVTVVSPIKEMQRTAKKLLKSSAFEPKTRYWLDSGSELFNAALGSPKFGLPYGKLWELRGTNHGGKTMLATLVAGLCQKDGAAVGYIDLENSRDPDWAGKLGLDFDNVYPIFPRLVKPKKKDTRQMPRLQYAEELIMEAEVAMEMFRVRGYEKQFWMLDSVANIQTEMVVEAGGDTNMRVNADRAQFLAHILPHISGLAYNYNAMVFLVNQLRTKIGVVFGSRKYSPGGNALEHNCSIRADVDRIRGGGVLRHGGHVAGICTKVRNFKNKAGKGSREQEAVAIKVRWDKTPASVKFLTVEEAETK